MSSLSRCIRPVALAVVALVAVAGCGLAQVNETSIAWTNDQRAQVGVGALASDAHLTGCAQQWADALASQGSLSHDPGLASCMPPGATTVGENLAQGSDYGAALEALLHSPSHMANMRDTQWTRFGVASAVNGNGHIVLVWRFSN